MDNHRNPKRKKKKEKRPQKKRRVDTEPDSDDGNGPAAPAAPAAAPVKTTTPTIDPRTGLPHYMTKLTADTSGTVTLTPTGPRQKPYPHVPECGTWDCLNGPPIVTDPITQKQTVFQTYSLCDTCRKIAPDVHDLGLAIIPPEWKKPGQSTKDVAEKNTKRRNKAATALGSRCMLELATKYPTVYGAANS